MIDNLVEKLVNKYLGKYIHIEKHKLNIGHITKGEVSIKSVFINPLIMK